LFDNLLTVAYPGSTYKELLNDLFPMAFRMGTQNFTSLTLVLVIEFGFRRRIPL